MLVLPVFSHPERYTPEDGDGEASDPAEEPARSKPAKRKRLTNLPSPVRMR